MITAALHQNEFLFEGPDRLYHLPGCFQVVQCTHCNWIRQNPRPTIETIGYYYPPEYENFLPAIDDEPSRLRQWDRQYGILKRRWAVERFKPGGRILDIGCATGNFLHHMHGVGWDAIGVEPNILAAHYAQERFGLQIHIGTLRQLQFRSSSFDVITLWDVLEHLHTPWLDLQEAHRLLADDGVLVLRIPNMESPERRLFGPTWIGWDLPRHLYFFPQAELQSALQELGFYLEGSQCIATSYASFLFSLQFFLEDRIPPPARLPKRLVSLAHRMPMRLLAAPFFWALSQARLSSVITLFARKKSKPDRS